MFDPIANHLSEQYFNLADREASEAEQAYRDGFIFIGTHQSAESDRYWRLGVVCENAAS